MRFHTTMIILHRPPPHLYSTPGINTTEDVEICYESLHAIFRLIRTFSRYYTYHHLPLDLVHTLSTAASCLLMRRYLDDLSWDDQNLSRSLTLILDVMRSIRHVHPCVGEIHDGLIHSARTRAPDTQPPAPAPADFALWLPDDPGLQGDLGVLLTDDILGGILPSNSGGPETPHLDP